MASTNRVAYSPGEFAELFGKSQTWGYRQIYAGKVNAITEHGRILIPAKEVERVLESAGIYNGREKPKQAKQRAEKLSPENKSIWRRFMESRKQSNANASEQEVISSVKSQNKPKWGSDSRKALLGKIAKSWNGSK